VETIQAVLRERAELAPGNDAILAPGRLPLSYGGLLHHVDRVAESLHRFGIGRGDRVAVVLPNGPEMATAFVAVAACAACAPLNPRYQGPEYEFFLGDLRPKALIVAEEGPATAVAREFGIPVIHLTALPDGPAGLFELTGEPGPWSSLPVPARPEDEALVLHTSGTTSRPKTVPLSQRNLVTSAANIRTTLQLTPADRCLNVMPLFHVHGLLGALLSSLSAGACLVATPGFDATAFFDWLDECRPTWYTAVPTMHQAVLGQAARHRDVTERSALRFIRSSSAALAPQLLHELEEVFDAPVIESYGMTEASHQMTSNPLPPGRRKPGSVGLAAGPDVAVMDPAGRLLDAERVGEVVIRGASVMRGYEGAGDANAIAFSDGWLRTGDQGYLDRDGYLWINGRIKEIINRGGEKVTPREIDEALLAHPAVTQAVAFAVPHPTLGEDVAAAVTLAAGHPPVGERELRDHLFERLSDFKVPSRIVVVERIPTGATGKLQRIGLADLLRQELRTEYVAPRDDLERGLALIWGRALGVSRVGVLENFFALGGDSLTAAEIFAAIEHEHGRSMPLATLFRAPTVEQLAQAMREGPSKDDWSSLVPIRPGGGRPPLFLVHPHGGNVVGYRPLADRLGPDQPVFGLQARGLDGRSVEPRTIEDMAAAYVEEIRGVQPVGPYQLGGWCMGGTLAYEMAQQLVRDGEQVALLVMINPSHRDYPRREGGSRWARLLTRLLDRAELEWTLVRDARPGRRGDLLRRRASRAGGTVLGRGRARVGWSRVRGTKDAPRTDVAMSLEAAHRTAMDRYAPRPYGGEVVFMRAARQPRGIVPDPRLGWGELLRGTVTEYEIRGFSLGMLEEGRVGVVADRLRGHLESWAPVG
jgi:acyl-CoA synthetase (AMP-forming)/AMP-acid ligase II/thioesterase domain-containing protein